MHFTSLEVHPIGSDARAMSAPITDSFAIVAEQGGEADALVLKTFPSQTEAEMVLNALKEFLVPKAVTIWKLEIALPDECENHSIHGSEQAADQAGVADVRAWLERSHRSVLEAASPYLEGSVEDLVEFLRDHMDTDADGLYAEVTHHHVDTKAPKPEA